VAVIFAVLAFGELFGFIGILLALPMAAIALVLLRFLRERYQASPLYAGTPGPQIVSPAGDATPSADAAPPADTTHPPVP
jgi:hypothetical protein